MTTLEEARREVDQYRAPAVKGGSQKMLKWIDKYNVRSDAGLGVLRVAPCKSTSSSAQSRETEEQERPDPEQDLLAPDALADEDGRDLDEPRPHRQSGADARLDRRIRDTDEVKRDRVVEVEDGS